MEGFEKDGNGGPEKDEDVEKDEYGGLENGEDFKGGYEGTKDDGYFEKDGDGFEGDFGAAVSRWLSEVVGSVQSACVGVVAVAWEVGAGAFAIVQHVRDGLMAIVKCTGGEGGRGSAVVEDVQTEPEQQEVEAGVSVGGRRRRRKRRRGQRRVD